LEQIRDGGFTDINGRPVIPAGTWHNGWSYGDYEHSFHPGGWTWWEVHEGRIEQPVMLQSELDKTLFMRNLVADGLFDAECLMQTDTMAKEKMVTGRVATHGVHWPHMNDFFETTLYITNPEMEYIPLGPFVYRDGASFFTVARDGIYGFGGLILSSKIKAPERALGLIEFLSNDEGGYILSSFGIEDVHYTMINGAPVRTEEWTTIQKEDQQRYQLEGFGFNQLNIEDRMKSYGWDKLYNRPGFVKARENRPLAFYSGFNVDDIASMWPGRPEYNEKIAVVNYGDLRKMMITASSDAETIEMMEDYRRRLREAGYDEMMNYVQQRINEDPTIVW
jgi:putative aldouronate transport system substrate-binding protein